MVGDVYTGGDDRCRTNSFMRLSPVFLRTRTIGLIFGVSAGGVAFGKGLICPIKPLIVCVLWPLGEVRPARLERATF